PDKRSKSQKFTLGHGGFAFQLVVTRDLLMPREQGKDEISAGGTGYGVRLLSEWLLNN
ncbi:hypothetical protein LCGC14_1690200, partial [marine sediment metagenome]